MARLAAHWRAEADLLVCRLSQRIVDAKAGVPVGECPGAEAPKAFDARSM